MDQTCEKQRIKCLGQQQKRKSSTHTHTHLSKNAMLWVFFQAGSEAEDQHERRSLRVGRPVLDTKYHNNDDDNGNKTCATNRLQQTFLCLSDGPSFDCGCLASNQNVCTGETDL